MAGKEIKAEKENNAGEKSSTSDSFQIPKKYTPDDEMQMYKLWEDSGYFNPDKMISDLHEESSKTESSTKKEVKSKKPFVITQPPPNANGELHIGHMCGYSFQDCMGRYNRMNGRPTLLLPGKDHAGIQTEAVFTKVLAERGLDKWEIGREKFYHKAYEFCTKNADHARQQEKRIGLSSDWSREKFTLDEGLNKVIFETFIKMFNEGMVYRDEYIINQCTHCKTALANIDTDHIEKKGIFAYIKYPYADDPTKFVTVATTRPETMLGDTAVAVSTDDDRYKDLVGKKVKLPLTDREIPVIAAREVDKDFGTGALKVTPAHSSIDFGIGKEHNLEVINVINEEGKMNDNAPEKYQGMTVKECRDAVIEDLKNEGLLVKVEDFPHEVIVCERCKNDIEQIMSKQWFVNIKSLAEKCIEALDKRETVVLPENQHRVLRQWFEKLEPWCISRQLWWGHQIPVWYCGSKKFFDWKLSNPDKSIEDFEKETGEKVNGCGNAMAAIDKPEKCEKCGKSAADVDIVQEEDVFDTWYSSGQWTFSTMGGPEGEDFKKFFPTDVMETARDILFFWVARMMMMSMYRTGKTPFHTVYLHGMILAADGQKMSKSKGNGVEPADVLKKYGADALRLWYYTATLPGQSTPIMDDKLMGNRNFVNKIWNASRFVMMKLEDLFNENEIKQLDGEINENLMNLKNADDEWLKQTYATATRITDYINKYRFNLAVEELREFFWHTVCDQWIEETKKLIDEDPENKAKFMSRLLTIIITSLKLIHPFAPFVTEYIWQNLKGMGLLEDGHKSGLLMMEKWPVEVE
ncbi:valine--tRNA ligase [Candidatus Dojkabacteria bacterium]|nr:valine--tRNA ligase [Candidatus Dojkabacteria bacterium]